MKRHWLSITAIVVGIIGLLFIALPLVVVHVYDFRSKIESEASAALGRQVSIGDLKLSVLSGRVEANNISIADDPAFSPVPFVTANSLKIGVELMPLIFGGNLHVTEIVLEKPEISLVKSPTGVWNFSSLGGASEKKPAESKAGSTAAPPNVSIGRLNVSDAKLTVRKVSSSRKPRVYDNVNIEVTDFSPTSQFPFKLTGNLPGGGDANISGKAGPISPVDAAKTPIETAVKVNNMNISAYGFIDPASGIAGIANFDGTLTSDGTHAKAVGTFTGTKMVLAPKGSPAPEALVIKHTVDVDLETQSGTLTQGDISVGKAQAHVTGTFKVAGDTEVVNLKLNAPNMPVESLEAMLPSLAIVLPTGSQLKGGTLSANLAITGPVDNLAIAGPIKLSDTSLVGFNLGSKMGALSAFAGHAVSNPDTTIHNFSLDAHKSPAGTQADNINLDVPAIGVVTGSGTVSPEGALAFKMLADLHGGAVGGVSKVATAGSGKGGIPFAIEGTTSDPKFVPALGGVAAGVATGAVKGAAGAVPGATAAPASAVTGLVGHKKS